MKAIIILITSFIIGTVTTNDSIKSDLRNCDAELSVENNNSFKSITEKGIQFVLILKNTSSNTSTYTLSATNLEEPCGNKTIISSGVNVTLNATFKFDVPSSKNEITLNSGQSNKLIVTVTAPEGTPYKNWGCIEIEAKSNGCSSSDIKTILSVYVPNPSEE